MDALTMREVVRARATDGGRVTVVTREGERFDQATVEAWDGGVAVVDGRDLLLDEIDRIWTAR